MLNRHYGLGCFFYINGDGKLAVGVHDYIWNDRIQSSQGTITNDDITSGAMDVQFDEIETALYWLSLNLPVYLDQRRRQSEPNSPWATSQSAECLTERSGFILYSQNGKGMIAHHGLQEEKSPAYRRHIA